MKKYVICADLYGYATVEAENEDEAWEMGKALTLSDFDVSDTIFDISVFDEED